MKNKQILKITENADISIMKQLLPQIDWDGSVMTQEDSELGYTFTRLDTYYKNSEGRIRRAAGTRMDSFVDTSDDRIAMRLLDHWGERSIFDDMVQATCLYNHKNSSWKLFICQYRGRTYLTSLISLVEENYAWYNSEGEYRQEVIGEKYISSSRSLGADSLPNLKINYNKLARLASMKITAGIRSFIKNKQFDIQIQMHPDFINLVDRWDEFIINASHEFTCTPIADVCPVAAIDASDEKCNRLVDLVNYFTFRSGNLKRFTINVEEPVVETDCTIESIPNEA